MNRAVLVGRLTKDPELRTTKSGTNQTTFTIAVNRRILNENGERQADFINCVAWNKNAENIKKYFFKGKEIAIDGHIQTGSYEAQDGTKRYTTDVVVDFFDFIGNKETQVQEREKEQDIVKEDVEDPWKDMGDIVELDSSELPF